MGLFRIDMDLGKMTTEKWLLAGAAVATIAFLAVAVLQPSLFDAEPDWGVSEGCIGGQTSHTAGEDIGIKFHYHPNLKVIVDGQQLSIDPNTGIDQMGCRDGMRWVHVHSSSDTGFTTLHIETPSKMNVPLGAFFEIWEREGGPALTDDREFDINRNGIPDWDEFVISMKVDGETNEKFEEYIMEDYDNIELIFTTK